MPIQETETLPSVKSYCVSIISGDTGRSEERIVHASSAIDLERKKSKLASQGHTIYLSREVTTHGYN